MALNFTRQFQHLQAGCNEIIKEDGVFSNGQFYQKLEDFIKFYDETRLLLLKTYEKDDLISERVKSLPELRFKNYDTSLALQTLLVIGYFLFFPIWIIHLIKKNHYVSGIKSKLHEISGSISSLQFLIKANE